MSDGLFRVPEEKRRRDLERNVYGHEGEGNNGCFLVPFSYGKRPMVARCIASDGGGWEHVSVTLNRNRTPTWDEMCRIKDLFWDKAAEVVQFHPAEAEYVNDHNYCLHLWRSVDHEMRLPDTIMV